MKQKEPADDLLRGMSMDGEEYVRKRHKMNTYNSLKKGMHLFIVMHYAVSSEVVIMVCPFP